MSPTDICLVSINSIQIPSGFDITTFLPDRDRNIFFLGSRQGALACYDLSSAKMLGVWRRIHDQEGVRSIKLEQSRKLSSTYTEILTTGRNCAYRIIGISVPKQFKAFLFPDTIDGEVEGLQLHPIQNNICNRGWLEGVNQSLLYWTDKKKSATVYSSLFLWGFYANRFRLWNETTGELIFDQDSGGPNRIWDFYFPPENEGNTTYTLAAKAWLVYSSKSKVYNSGGKLY